MFKFFKMLKSKNNWRNKATERNQKIKNFQKRVKDLEKSRNIWKEKATIYKEYNNELKDELKKKLQILKSKRPGLKDIGMK